MGEEKEIAIFGGGCFWCTEAVFSMLKGVISITPGYAGGNTENPTYEDVSSGTTAHAEVIQIEFDPRTISYNDLLTVFFSTHDSTTPNQQGGDKGTQYRSIILTTNEDQKKSAELKIKQIHESEKKGTPVVTEVRQLEHFTPAESYHKEYYKKNSWNPYCLVVINPKLKKVKKEFSQLLKKDGA